MRKSLFLKARKVMTAHYLQKMFEPQSIGVIGASNRPTSVGMRVFKNLLQGGFRGQLYPINPKHHTVEGQICYHSLNEINDPIDLAVITTPAATLPHILTQCGQKGIHHVIILSSGFSETGEVGRKLEQHLLDIAKGYHIRMIGPNCLGLMRPCIHMNATFDNTHPSVGGIGLVSQSGALSAAILDWSIEKKVGFSTIACLGNSADIDFADILDYLAFDSQTQSILLYIEGIKNARRFMSALRATARMKPVIAIKAGRHAAGTRAAMSHTGALVGSDDVFDTALKRAGVVRVLSIEELFIAAEILSSHYRVNGNRLFIITNGGGAGVMAADYAADLGIQLPELSEETSRQLDQVLPPQWSHQNPVDIIGDATPERYHTSLNICAKADNMDGILAMLVPVAMVQPLKVAEQIVKDAKTLQKPILACWMGEKQVKSSWNLFAENQLPFFNTPEKAIQAFSYLAQYHLNQKLLLQVPEPLSPQPIPHITQARSIIQQVLNEKRTLLTAIESKSILNAFSIPVNIASIAENKAEALNVAKHMGFPLAMKIHSPDITHKRDVGGVILNLTHLDAVGNAYDKLMQTIAIQAPNARILGVTLEPMFKNPNDREVLIGVIRDQVFGPVITFGAGGTLVEILKDRTLALPPLNQFVAKQLIDQTRIAKLLGQFRNMPAVNLDLIINILLRVSEMVCEFPEIEEMDINPLIVNERTAMVVDARIVIHPKPIKQVPYAHMAIHPYPHDLIETYVLNEASSITIRPIRPEDAYMTQDFVRNLSSESKYFRFMQHIRELTPQTLVRLTQIDYDREMTLIAVYQPSLSKGISQITDALSNHNETEVCIGLAHYVTNPDRESCEFAIAIADQWQHKGLGSKLMHSLKSVAQKQGLNQMVGSVIATNKSMLDMTQQLGFQIQSSEDPVVKKVVHYF